MKCMICDRDNIECVETVISDFVMARIEPEFINGKVDNKKVKLCYCRDCTFAFYDYRFNETETNRLYDNYRDSEYQKLREKYEYWYTSKVNYMLNSDKLAIDCQKKGIISAVNRNITSEIKVALDYGGNEGKSFSDQIGTQEKYVYDISGVDTIEGVNSISSIDELKKHSYDFVMCNMVFEHLAVFYPVLDVFHDIGSEETVYYVEVPSENPFEKGNKFSIKNNLKLLTRPEINKIKLLRYYIKTKKEPFMPMKEHINFFTPKSLQYMIEKKNFKIIDCQEMIENSVLGKNTVLYALFKKKTNIVF